MAQFYLQDHFKALDHITHGAMKDFPKTPSQRKKFSVNVTDYQSCVVEAKNLNHLCALVAVKTASTLKSRGVSDKIIVNFLSQTFAKTGTIREYGQQKRASRIVNLVLKEIKECGQLPGIASKFRQLSRPKVRKYYHGQPNLKL